MTPMRRWFRRGPRGAASVLAEGFKLPEPCAKRAARRRQQRLVDQGAQQILDHADKRCAPPTACAAPKPNSPLNTESRSKKSLFDRCQQVI